MICPRCKGERVVYQNFVHEIKLVPCPTCDGRGEVVITNFDRITDSPEKLAEFIVDAMVIYDGNRHVFVTEAIEMAKKKNVNLACDSIYKDVVDWLKEESEMREVSHDQKETKKETEKGTEETEVVQEKMGQ